MYIALYTVFCPHPDTHSCDFSLLPHEGMQHRCKARLGYDLEALPVTARFGVHNYQTISYAESLGSLTIYII